MSSVQRKSEAELDFRFGTKTCPFTSFIRLRFDKRGCDLACTSICTLKQHAKTCNTTQSAGSGVHMHLHAHTPNILIAFSMAFGTDQSSSISEWICEVSLSSSRGLITINNALKAFWDLESLTFWHYAQLNGRTVKSFIVRRQQWKISDFIGTRRIIISVIKSARNRRELDKSRLRGGFRHTEAINFHA